jgi:hypothetical protein
VAQGIVAASGYPNLQLATFNLQQFGLISVD